MPAHKKKHQQLQDSSRRGICTLSIGIIWGLILSQLIQLYVIPRLSPPAAATTQQQLAATTLDGFDVSLRSSQFPRDSLHALVDAVKKHASKDIVDQCVTMVQGSSLSASFSQASQDWFLFHNFFSHLPFGSGFYLDIGANHPRDLSNSFFFDRCLGWRGICIEPNENYHPLYVNRTCSLVKNCIFDSNITISMDFKAGTHGRLGTGRSDVECRPLEDILEEHGVKEVQFASLDVEGTEANALHCFPFHNFDIKVWLVETDKVGAEFNRLMLRGGYGLVGDILCPFRPLHSDSSRVGVKLDSVFAKRAMPAVYGPDFMWGAKLHGRGPQPACRPKSWCAQQMPVIERDEVEEGNLTLKLASCRHEGLPLSEQPWVYRG